MTWNRMQRQTVRKATLWDESFICFFHDWQLIHPLTGFVLHTQYFSEHQNCSVHWEYDRDFSLMRYVMQPRDQFAILGKQFCSRVLTKCIENIGDQNKFAGVELNDRHISQQFCALKYDSALRKYSCCWKVRKHINNPKSGFCLQHRQSSTANWAVLQEVSVRSCQQICVHQGIVCWTCLDRDFECFHSLVVIPGRNQLTVEFLNSVHVFLLT